MAPEVHRVRDHHPSVARRQGGVGAAAVGTPDGVVAATGYVHEEAVGQQVRAVGHVPDGFGGVHRPGPQRRATISPGDGPGPRRPGRPPGEARLAGGSARRG